LALAAQVELVKPLEQTAQIQYFQLSHQQAVAVEQVMQL
jgi:hypothetical protein